MTTQRLEAFSDGVFAVAITLLAFDVRLPALPQAVSETALQSALVALAPKLFSYLMTFALVGMFWIAHHRMFTSIRHVNRPLLWLNIVFLLWICLLPFSAATLGAYLLYRTAVLVYGANVLCIGLLLFALWQYVSRRSLLDPATPDGLIRATTRRIVVGLPLYVLGMAAAFWDTRISTIVYLFALAIYLVPHKVDALYSGRVDE